MADQVENTVGPIDLWVNCAFVGTLPFAWDTGIEQIAAAPTSPTSGASMGCSSR